MNSFTIELLGHKLSIKTEDSEAHVGNLIKYIETTMARLDPENKLPETTRLLLCLLNLTDDLFKEKQRLEQTGSKAEKHSEIPHSAPPNSTIH